MALTLTDPTGKNTTTSCDSKGTPSFPGLASGGGMVDGHSTQKYVYSGIISGVVETKTAWAIDGGELKDGIIHLEDTVTKDDKTITSLG